MIETPGLAIATGRFGWILLNRYGRKKAEGKFRNGITTEGLNSLLNTHFRSASQSANWYGGLIDNSGYSALAAADTMSSHSGWTELTAYTSATRVAWSPGAAASGLLTAAAMSFTMNATKSIVGAFLVSNSTKGGTTGTLYCTGLIDAVQNVVNTDVFQLTYETQIQSLT